MRAELEAAIGAAWNRQGGMPQHHRLRKAMRECIAQGVWRGGDALPPERLLAACLGITRATARTALAGLADEGLIERRRGAGSFVRSVEQLQRTLPAPSHSVVLWEGEGAVTPDEALRLRLSPGAPVMRSERLRFLGDQPLCLEQVTVDGNAGGARPVRSLQSVRALRLELAQAELLQVPAGQAGLAVEQVGMRADGRAVEWRRSLYRADLYDFVAELTVCAS